MKRPSLKPTLSILTFLIGVIAVSLWYFSNVELISEKSLSEAISTVRPVEHIYENSCNYPQPHFRELKAEEAVYQAECFIIQNGYTDLPPIADKSKITPESVWGLDDDEGMKMRRDSLERKAYSYYRDGLWVVMFRYKPHSDVVKFYGDRLDYIGRAVMMDLNGKDLRIKHSDYPLRIPEAIIINP
jgi:hypothetical protein